MRERIARFMMGRYGVDALGKANLVVVLILMLINMFANSGWLYWTGLVLLLIAYWRMFSKNIQRRYAENQWFLKHFGCVSSWMRRQKSYQAQKKEHRIFTCPSCKQKVRVPKGKGKISIRCPKCGTEFVKRS